MAGKPLQTALDNRSRHIASVEESLRDHEVHAAHLNNVCGHFYVWPVFPAWFCTGYMRWMSYVLWMRNLCTQTTVSELLGRWTDHETPCIHVSVGVIYRLTGLLREWSSDLTSPWFRVLPNHLWRICALKSLMCGVSQQNASVDYWFKPSRLSSVGRQPLELLAYGLC